MVRMKNLSKSPVWGLSMTPSDSGKVVSLTIRAADPETEIIVFDGRFQVVARGVGRLTERLEEGLYKVKLRNGLDIFEENIVLQGDQDVSKDYPPLGFKSSAPLANTTRTREYHIAAAEKHSRNAHVTLGQGSSIFVFARDWTGPGTTVPSGMNPAAGLSLVTLEDGNLIGQPLVDFAQASVTDYQNDAWAACNVRVIPGRYRLRLTLPGGGIVEQTIVASPGWQTQIFLLQRNYYLDGSSESNSARVPAGRCADLSGASILMARGEGFSYQDEGARRAELARLSLLGRRRTVPDEVRSMLGGKYENPMLGIFGGHLLLMESTVDTNFLQIVVSNLRALLGPHPDVEALAIATEIPGFPGFFDLPPMLRQSFSLIVRGTLKKADLIPNGSFTEKIAEEVIRDDPWLIWRSPIDTASEVNDDEVSALESVVETYVWAQKRSVRNRTSEEPTSVGGQERPADDAALESFGVGGEKGADAHAGSRSIEPSPSVDVGAEESFSFDDSKLDALVKSLDLPRSQVEKVVEKVRTRSRPRS